MTTYLNQNKKIQKICKWEQLPDLEGKTLIANIIRPLPGENKDRKEAITCKLRKLESLEQNGPNCYNAWYSMRGGDKVLLSTYNDKTTFQIAMTTYPRCGGAPNTYCCPQGEFRFEGVRVLGLKFNTTAVLAR